MEAIGYSFRVYKDDGSEFFKTAYIGKNASQHFISVLKNIEDSFQDYCKTNVEMSLTDYQICRHAVRTNCEECGIRFNNNSSTCVKTRHHDHLTGEYISALCCVCNFKKKKYYYIPCYGHNMTHFDSNLILEVLDEAPTNSISHNSEAVMTFCIGKFKFLDSLLFLKQSLADLSENLLAKDPSLFSILRSSELCQTQGKFDQQKFNLLTAKLVFPYKALEDGILCLERKDFLDKKYFYNELTESDITKSQHEKAIQIAHTFNCTTFKQYLALYVKLDTILLADVWFYFVKSLKTDYQGLNPESGYISINQYIFDAVKARVKRERGHEIQLISDQLPDFHNDCSKGIRGGNVFLKTRLAFSTDFEEKVVSLMNLKEKAQYKLLLINKCSESTFQSNQLKKMGHTKKCINPICKNIIDLSDSKYCNFHSPTYILPLDFTNLYGVAMSSKLPVCNFQKLSTNELKNFQKLYNYISLSKKYNGQVLDENSKTGYIFGVDLEFPKDAHKKLDQFVVCSAKKSITKDMLSLHQKRLWKKLYPNVDFNSVNQELLVPTFDKIQNYVVHYTLLKCYCKLGMKVTILRGYKFDQDNIIASHISACTEARAKATSKIDQISKKNQSNTFYGKTAEQLHKRVKIQYFTDFKKLEKSCRNRTVTNFKIIHSNLVQVSFQPTQVTLNRPIYLGFCILEISKRIVLDFFYNTLCKKFHSSKIKCCYSDTDSYYLEIKGYDEDTIFSKLNDHIDFSNFPSDHPRFNNDKKFKLGFLKVDTGCRKINAFMAVRKKSYCYYTSLPGENSVRSVKLKGVKKTVFPHISLENYKQTILDGCVLKQSFKKIGKNKHRLYMTEQRKIALNSFDASCRYKTCGICTTTYSKDKNNQYCHNIDCEIKKLLLSVWTRYEKDKH